jgi:hypothetical protein
MGVIVYHGTNERLLSGMQKAGSITAARREPLIEEIRTRALNIGDQSSYRMKMILRQPEIYIATDGLNAQKYATFSPEVLTTSLNLIKESNASLFSDYMARLENDGWLGTTPVVLHISISSPGELGLPNEVPFTIENLAAIAAPTDELRIAMPLPISRIIRIENIDQPHYLAEMKNALEQQAEQREKTTPELFGELVEGCSRLIDVMPGNVTREEAEVFDKFFHQFEILAKVHAFLMDKQRRDEVYTPLLMEILDILKPFTEAYFAFRDSSFRQKIKGLDEYVRFKEPLVKMMKDIARIYGHRFYLTHSVHKTGLVYFANMFYLTCAESGNRVYNTNALAADELDINALAQTLKNERIKSTAPEKIVAEGFMNPFMVGHAEFPYSQF